MSKFLPPKPNFNIITNGYSKEYRTINEIQFDEWYDREMAPLFENTEKMYGVSKQTAPPGEWHFKKYDWATHSALLINIKPIKEESSDNLLEEIVKASEGYGLAAAIDKAKAYLERKGEK